MLRPPTGAVAAFTPRDFGTSTRGSFMLGYMYPSARVRGIGERRQVPEKLHKSPSATEKIARKVVYPVVGLYPLVKCKVVMLLVAGSSYTLKIGDKTISSLLRPDDLDQVRARGFKLLFPIPASLGVNPSDHSEDFINLYFQVHIGEP